MVEPTSTLLALLIILFLGLIVPDLFKKLRLPFVTTIIILGAIFGPYGLNYVQSNAVIEFFGFLGLTFLMLMAGLEIKIEHLQKLGKKIILMAVFNGFVPFFVGLGITLALGYSMLSALLIGVVFVSSSVAVITAVLKATDLFDKEVGQTIVSVVVLEDIISLFMLSFILQGTSPITEFPLPIYFALLLGSIISLKTIVPKLAEYFFKKIERKKDRLESEIRFIIVLLIAILLLFSGLGVHPIVAAFMVGLLLSDVVKSEHVYSKLHTLGYGLFVPVFFFIVGMELNLGVLMNVEQGHLVIISIILGSLIAKFASGYLAGRWTKFSKRNSIIFGVTTTPQLTTTLAVTYAAAALNILDSSLVTAIIVLSIVTTILAPVTINTLKRENKK
jgi:Kef-type K+ transport system membrane component KefB